MRPRMPRWNLRNAIRLGVLGTVMAMAVAIVGFHSHVHSHGDLTVRDQDGGSITVREWRLGAEPEELDAILRAGALTFTLRNADSVQHDFYVVRSDAEPDALPTANGRVDVASLGEIVASGQIVNPGETDGLTFGFEPGEYVLFCNQTGHYEHGMYYKFSVR